MNVNVDWVDKIVTDIAKYKGDPEGYEPFIQTIKTRIIKGTDFALENERMVWEIEVMRRIQILIDEIRMI